MAKACEKRTFPKEEWYTYFIVYSGGRDPEYVTKILGVVPTSMQREGEVITNPFGKRRIAQTNFWEINSSATVRARPISEHLDWTLSKIADRSERIRILQAQGMEIWVRAVIYTTASAWRSELTLDQMARLTALNLNYTPCVHFD